jgi:hypothetical protein
VFAVGNPAEKKATLKKKKGTPFLPRLKVSKRGGRLFVTAAAAAAETKLENKTDLRRSRCYLLRLRTTIAAASKGEEEGGGSSSFASSPIICVAVSQHLMTDAAERFMWRQTNTNEIALIYIRKCHFSSNVTENIFSSKKLLTKTELSKKHNLADFLEVPRYFHTCSSLRKRVWGEI